MTEHTPGPFTYRYCGLRDVAWPGGADERDEMSTEHSRSPWLALPAAPPMFESDKYIPIDSGGGIVAYVVVARPDLPSEYTRQLAANARLIAAAPTTFAACKAFLRWYELLDDDTEFLPADHDRLTQVVAVMRANITSVEPTNPKGGAE